ncbi:MAG: HU family DNA-binding protein [SAR324 cluster bacterium]|nr:HU family DNA-binding protein [SAR324 cluster bacterium]
METGTKVKTGTARETVNLFFNPIKESQAAGYRVEIWWFGSFLVKEYEGYTGRNPKKLPVYLPGTR